MKEKKVVSFIVLFLLAMCVGYVTQTHAGSAILSIKPSEITVEPDQEFTVDINVTNVENMYAYEFKIYFKNSILNATKAIRPLGHFMEPSDPTLQFVPKWEIKNNFNETHGRIWLGFTLLSPETPKSGSGILARITFKAIGKGSTLLSFKDTKLADNVAQPIPHVVEECTVTVKLPEIPQPTIEVNPKIISPSRRGEIISINITVTNLDVRWKAVGFEFKLGFNRTLLQVVNVTEGSFLKAFGETFMVPPIIGGNYVHVGVLLLPQVDGNYTVFPEGNGTLATISFNVIHGPPASTDLNLYDTKIADATGIPPGVPHAVVPGKFIFVLEILAPIIVWTDPATNQTHKFTLQTVSNSTINAIEFNQLHRYLSFTLTGPAATKGFCNITIPKQLLYAERNNWLLLVDGRPAAYETKFNGTHTSIYFTYPLSTKYVYIFGTSVIPEFSMSMLLAVFLAITASFVAITKLTLLRKQKFQKASTKST